MTEKPVTFPCYFCNKFMSYNDLIKAPKVYVAHWMPEADGTDWDKFAHQECFEKNGKKITYGYKVIK